MRHRADLQLFLLAIAASLTLTGVTVWAVARQARALEAREIADLRGGATAAATRQQAALTSDLQRAFEAAARAQERGGPDEFEAWLMTQPDLLMAGVASGAAGPALFPRTPLEDPLPAASAPAEAPGAGSDVLSLLRSLQRLAGSADPLTRAGALLAMAACEQQLGHPLAAARLFADAAQQLRTTPHLARFAFRAELARIDALLAAGDRERARDAWRTLLTTALADHPGRLGALELERLGQQEQQLALGVDEAGQAALDELRERAQCRADAAAALRVFLAAGATNGTSATALRFARADRPGEAGGAFIMAERNRAPDVRIAMLMRLDDLLERYWPPAAQGPAWQVRPPGEPAGLLVLVQLGPEFGDAVLEVSPETAANLSRGRHREWALVLATGLGSIGAWALVIWMMLRALARQRELARLQGRFVADVSHELKTPLALIRLLAETLADNRVRDPERVRSYHETITREAERLSVLLDNILDLGRIESGRKKYQFGVCAIADVARQAWTLFEPQFAAERFDARLELEPDLPTLRADPQALQQVLVNLLQNAYRYAGAGKFVRLHVGREGYLVVITVEDHGIGMSRQELERLGESFFRADDTRVRQTRGAGLGLAICNHILAAHQGKLEVHSRPGQGSRFTVWIPIEASE